jgi:5-methylcytosine-specific restriction endonuclease McrA
MSGKFVIPAHTKCPFGGVNKDGSSRTISNKNDAPKQLFPKISGGCEISCSKTFGCGKKHTRMHFEKAGDTITAEIMSKVIDFAKNKPKEIVINTMETLPIQPNLVVEPPKRKPGRPPKPLDKEKHDNEFNIAQERYISYCNSIATCYEDKVQCCEKTGKPKQGFTDTTKRQSWMKIYGENIVSAKCPICWIKVIQRDDFIAGHIFPECFGGANSVDNIMPICDDCNGGMGSQHLYSYAWKFHRKALFPILHHVSVTH